MCPYIRKEKCFMNDFSQKTCLFLVDTGYPYLHGSWDGKYCCSGLYRRRQKGRRGLGMAVQHPVNSACHKCIISLGYIWGGEGSCEGKHVAEVSHSHEFYERFAGKLLLRKYIWWLWFPRQHNWVICNVVAIHGLRSKNCHSLSCQTLELFQDHQAGPLLNYIHLLTQRCFRSPQCMVRSVLALLIAVASTLLICLGKCFFARLELQED